MATRRVTWASPSTCAVRALPLHRVRRLRDSPLEGHMLLMSEAIRGHQRSSEAINSKGTCYCKDSSFNFTYPARHEESRVVPQDRGYQVPVVVPVASLESAAVVPRGALPPGPRRRVLRRVFTSIGSEG